MSLVYVHGIGNRAGTRYDNGEAERNALFRRFLVPALFGAGAEVSIRSPLWGEEAARLREDHATIPGDGLESLGGTDAGTALTGALTTAGAVGDEDAVLLGVARHSLPDAVDLAYSLAGADGEATAEAAADVVAYAEFRTSLYPTEAEPVRYPWLGDVTDDVGFLERLHTEVRLWRSELAPPPAPASSPAIEVLGAGDPAVRRLTDGVRRMRQVLADRQSAPVATALRRLVAPRVTMLLGDVLSYLGRRGTPQEPGKIVRIVADAVDAAAADPGPCVVIAHSMGGNIVYDLLSHFRPDLRADLLVTVGTQVGLFEELGLFPGSRPEAKPAGIGRWLNVVDRADVLSYRVSPMIAGVEDYVYPSGALWAHTAYLRQPHFHARLARRARTALESAPA